MLIQGRRSPALWDAGPENGRRFVQRRSPYAAREIVTDAQGHDVDVIVMGSRGRGDLAGLVLGSTAHKVIHLADRPVLIVR
jgi:nucleotide-binding universal stress UspA family protein